MDDNFVNDVVSLYKQGDWKNIIERYYDYPERNKLLWVFPSVENLNFLNKCAKELNIESVTSIGCGSGLLEWIIKEATGLHVTGIEVDQVWWCCKYAPPTFIPLLCTTEALNNDVLQVLQNNNTALLFCYFNNRPAFETYLKHFKGKVIIIIGPGEGKGVHTDPRAFDDVSDDWKLYDWQEVRNSQDFIAVYCKK